MYNSTVHLCILLARAQSIAHPRSSSDTCIRGSADSAVHSRTDIVVMFVIRCTVEQWVLTNTALEESPPTICLQSMAHETRHCSGSPRDVVVACEERGIGTEDDCLDRGSMFGTRRRTESWMRC